MFMVNCLGKNMSGIFKTYVIGRYLSIRLILKVIVLEWRREILVERF